MVRELQCQRQRLLRPATAAEHCAVAAGTSTGDAAVMDLIRLVIVGLLAAIIISLGTALYHLSSGKGDSRKLLRALTVRIALSLLLFVLLMAAWRAGLIAPRSLQP